MQQFVDPSRLPAVPAFEWDLLGSHLTWKLLRAGRVVELHLMLEVPGSERDLLFTGPTARRRLIDTHRVEGSDSVVPRYSA